MAVINRAGVKQYFEPNDKPSAVQFGDSWDSVVFKIDDASLLGLKDYDGGRTYAQGEGCFGVGIPKVYRATTAVPVSTPPPDVSFWEEQNLDAIFEDIADSSTCVELNSYDGADANYIWARFTADSPQHYVLYAWHPTNLTIDAPYVVDGSSDPGVWVACSGRYARTLEPKTLDVQDNATIGGNLDVSGIISGDANLSLNPAELTTHTTGTHTLADNVTLAVRNAAAITTIENTTIFTRGKTYVLHNPLNDACAVSLNGSVSLSDTLQPNSTKIYSYEPNAGSWVIVSERTDWTVVGGALAPSYGADWGTSAGLPGIRFRKKEGLVEIQGFAEATANGETDLFTLPTGLRPADKIQRKVSNHDTALITDDDFIEVTAAGAVIPYTTSPPPNYISGQIIEVNISFYVG